jgi:hypothetical protein
VDFRRFRRRLGFWGSVKDGKPVGFLLWGEYNGIEAVVTDDAGNIYAGFTNTLTSGSSRRTEAALMGPSG